MDFWTAVQTCFRKYATFQGRARRSEFWYFWLFLVLGNIVAAILDAALGTDLETGGGVVSNIFALVTLLPILAAVARRLHDTDHSGWWQLGSFVPALVMGFTAGWIAGSGQASGPAMLVLVVAGIVTLVVSILVLIWLVRAGDRGPNRFGPDPMGPPEMAQAYGPPGGGAWR